MSLPLPTLTYYRLPDVAVAEASIAGLLDAIHDALGSAVDHRGTALPATHQWAWARHQNAGTTDAVYTTAVPSGPGVSPRIIFAGATTGAPTMCWPDTFIAASLLVGVNKYSGDYASAGQGWDQALPFTTGQFSGYYRAAGTPANSTSTVIRCYVSQETVFVDVIETATSHRWIFAGATIEPWTDDTLPSSLVSETDNRLYGMCVSGAGFALSPGFLSSNTVSSSGTFLLGGTNNANPHNCVLIPNSTGTHNIESVTYWRWGPGGQHADLSGRYVAQAVDMALLGPGASVGRLRELYRYGSGHGGRTIRNGSIDLLHIVSSSTTFADDAIVLRAAA